MRTRDRFALLLDNLRSIKDYARACHSELERIRVAVEAREERVTYVTNRTGDPEYLAADPTEPNEERDCT